jgi:rhamnulokinase
MVAEVTGGRIDLREVHRFTNEIVRIGGNRHWDAVRLGDEIRRGIDAAGALDGIGIDTWGVDYGLLDGLGELVAMPFCYRDVRHEFGMRAVEEHFAPEELYGICGIQAIAINTIYQLAAEQELRPDFLRQADRLLFMPDLFCWMLTGEKATEYTIASTSGLLDAGQRTWAWEVIDKLALPRRLFGELKMPGAVAGDYNGVPVYLVGAHDTASAVAAVPASGDNWAFLSSGTWSLIGVELDEPLLTEDAARANFTNEGGIDGRIRFLKNVTGLWLVQECRRNWAAAGQDLSFAKIAEAAEAAGFSGCFDPNDRRFTAPDNMVAAIQGWFRERGEPVPESVGEVARSCYLSLASAYAEQLALLRRLTGKRIDNLHVVGAGSQATLLNQLTADACNVPVIAGPVEATALGNVGVQAMANGLFGGVAEIREAVAANEAVVRYEPGS